MYQDKIYRSHYQITSEISKKIELTIITGYYDRIDFRQLLANRKGTEYLFIIANEITTKLVKQKLCDSNKREFERSMNGARKSMLFRMHRSYKKTQPSYVIDKAKEKLLIKHIQETDLKNIKNDEYLIKIIGEDVSDVTMEKARELYQLFYKGIENIAEFVLNNTNMMVLLNKVIPHEERSFYSKLSNEAKLKVKIVLGVIVVCIIASFVIKSMNPNDFEQIESLIAKEIYDKANEELEVYIENNPDSKKAYKLNSLAYLYQNELEKAESNIEKAYEMDQNDSEVLMIKGTIFRLNQDYEQALTYLESAYSMKREDEMVVYQLAMCYFELENYEQVSKLALFSLVDKIEDAELSYLFCLSYNKLGKKDMFKEHYDICKMFGHKKLGVLDNLEWN